MVSGPTDARASDAPVVAGLYRDIPLPHLTLKGNILLAPMAGWSDAAFRLTCSKWGASLCFTEMVSAEALLRGNPKARALLVRAPGEGLPAVQIFASRPASAAAAVRDISRRGAALIDLNCGCSVAKVLKTGSGAALLKAPALIGDILRAMRNETDTPVSVKLRSGWDAESINYPEAGEHAVDAGAVMVTLHPRTRAELFTGRAHWDHIRALQRQLDVPVIGSGDLFIPGDVRSMLLETGCRGVMIARGAMGNPFIFARSVALLTEGRTASVEPGDRIRLETALSQLRAAIELKGERTACREARKHFSAYTKGMSGAAALRRCFCRASTYREYEEIVLGRLDGRSG